MRACIIFNVTPHYRKVIEKLCYLLYILPLAIMTPVYYAALDKRGVAPLNTSDYNKLIFKPLNISLVVVTEFIATLSDIFIIRKVQGTIRREAERKVVESVHDADVKNIASTVHNHDTNRVLGIPAEIWGNYVSYAC
jgi:hypothetical protein